MKTLAILLLACATLPLTAQPSHPSTSRPAALPATERLGTVSFPVSCAPSSQASFNRGVALLHDFWYAQARTQFNQLAKGDPACAMAHWGVAMSAFHQIWNRPDPEAMQLGWKHIQAAQSLSAQANRREQAYIAALADFYRPGPTEFPARVSAYASAMAKLYAQYPQDVDAGAFYALALLADKAPDDTSLSHEQDAMAILKPLFVQFPDNPGVVHYIVHACDNPAMASQGLAAANHYLQIAPDGPHAAHMPGHIYARLGLWPQDIASQLDSIQASQAADARGESGLMDELHSYDFLIYAYLQSGQDIRAKAALKSSATPLKAIADMPGGGGGYRAGMVPYYATKLPAFYALEMRDWNSAAALEPVAGSPPEVATTVYWARALADGHLRRPAQARADLARYNALTEEIKKGKDAYVLEGTGPKIERNEVLAWVAFAESKQAEALSAMRAAADLQDKVGQGEVDIPAREMLGDMLLHFGHPHQALANYEVALKLSPNRLNGLYNAGRAAEAAGDQPKARMLYASLLQSTGSGRNSTRPEIAHAISFISSTGPASK